MFSETMSRRGYRFTGEPGIGKTAVADAFILKPENL